jgi:hypothetical protein
MFCNTGTQSLPISLQNIKRVLCSQTAKDGHI